MSEDEVLTVLQNDLWPSVSQYHTAYFSARHFRPSMGWKGDRRFLDLWVIGLTAAQHFPTHGVEVKVSRGDWLRELKQPLKRRMAEAVSNFMWVATPKGIVKPEELPPRWGLIEVDPTQRDSYHRYKIEHPADFCDKVRPTWAFIASALAQTIKLKDRHDA